MIVIISVGVVGCVVVGCVLFGDYLTGLLILCCVVLGIRVSYLEYLCVVVFYVLIVMMFSRGGCASFWCLVYGFGFIWVSIPVSWLFIGVGDSFYYFIVMLWLASFWVDALSLIWVVFGLLLVISIGGLFVVCWWGCCYWSMFSCRVIRNIGVIVQFCW